MTPRNQQQRQQQRQQQQNGTGGPQNQNQNINNGYSKNRNHKSKNHHRHNVSSNSTHTTTAATTTATATTASSSSSSEKKISFKAKWSRRLKQYCLVTILLFFVGLGVSISANITQNVATQQAEEQTEEADLPTRKIIQSKAVRNWAYAFFLGGIPTTTTTTSEAQAHASSYRGLLYNIMVSAQILRDSKSQADILVLVHTAEPHGSLPHQDAQMLRAMNITVQYVPPTMPDYINGFSTIALEKFRLLDYTQYSRILYMNPDVMPYCNLDYLFHWSENGPESILQENVILSIGNQPAWTGMFMIRPIKGHYRQFLKILQDFPKFFIQFEPDDGWGHAFQKPKDVWHSIRSMRNYKKTNNDLWNFDGAQLDAGLLYHWMRYIRKKVTIIIGKTSHTIVNGKVKPQKNLLQDYTCLPQQDEKSGKGHQWYSQQEVKAIMSPHGIAPYRDVAQWQHNENKPWNYAQAPPPLEKQQITNARQYWFHVLRQISDQYGFDFGFQSVKSPLSLSSLITSQEAAEHLNGPANWNYVPRKPPLQKWPIWSTKVHALIQWERLQMSDRAASKSWKPPLIPTAHQPPPSQQQTSKDEDPDGTLFTCNCSSQILVDPCSNPDMKVEEWLQDRQGMRLSKHRPACPNAARNHFHILLPFANLGVEAVHAAYCSVSCQNYPSNKRTIYLYEDGSDESVLHQLCHPKDIVDFEPPSLDPSSTTSSYEEFDAMARNFSRQFQHSNPQGATMCIRAKENIGPGGAKYWGFRLVEATAGANDIAVVIDGDDELYSDKALEIINNHYIEGAKWFTYGSYVGKWAEQVKGIPRGYLDGTDAFQPRKDKPAWRFGHPRTFKTHLLRRISRIDFTTENNSWLMKATDRGFVYRMLELSGVDRIGYIKQPIYRYNWSAKGSTVAVVPKEVRVAQLEHVQSLEPSQRLNLPFHIVVVCWSRTYLLKEQLVWLQQQTLAENRQLVIHLLSNNADTHDEVQKSVSTFQGQQQQYLSGGIVPIDVRVIHNSENWHAFSRFLYVQGLREREPMDLIFFLDDDQYWLPDFLVSLLQYFKPKGMTTWYGKTFVHPDLDSGLGDFWKSNITWTNIIQKHQTETETFTYGGPGGSVFDVNLWTFDQQLLRLKYDLKQYFAFDDVWVSYVIDALLGWEHRRLPMPLPVDIANCNHELYQEILFPLLPEGQAEKLLKLNNETADNIKAVATFRGEAKTTKTNMFEDMQTVFKWDVMRNNTNPLKQKRIGTDSAVAAPFFTYLGQSLPSNDTKRAFICITGQFSRLELQNKIQNFFVPMQKLGYDLDLALVLSGGSSSFTNENYGKLSKLRPQEHLPFYKEFPDALDDLLRQNITVVSPHDKKEGTYHKLKDPVIHLQYLEGLYHSQVKLRTFEEQRQRSQNHPRIYESYQRCLSYAEKSVKEAAEKVSVPPTLESYYDVYIRIREDVGFEEKLPESTLRQLLSPPPNSVTTTLCRGWSGMNDRFAVVSPDVAKTYYTRPYRIFEQNEYLGEHIVINPETFLLYAFLTAGIQVYGMPDLKGLIRVFKTSSGKPDFYKDDLVRQMCPTLGISRSHLYELYGWSF